MGNKSGDGTLSVPKTSFCNIGGEVHHARAAWRARLVNWMSELNPMS
jgi:hypothetical protein